MQVLSRPKVLKLVRGSGSGARGPQGRPGADGADGAQGEPGQDGIDGAQGIQGESGEQGPQGDAGPQGATGPAGADGAAGQDGSAGAQGPQGDQGETGLTGPQGVPGAAGAKGDTGLTGSAGATGPKGDTGFTGATGPTGPTGSTGATGAAGPMNIIQESSGPTYLAVGAIADGQLGYRSGSTFVGKTIGSGAGTVAAGNDSRLSDARTPTSHASSHAAAGSDPVTITPTQAGLSAVTNDAQTKAAISGYAAKSPVTGADIVYLGDSAASFALKKATLTDVVALASSAAPAGSSGWPLYGLPTVGSDLTFNDEFDAGSVDLATRGWIVVDWATGVVMTRRGNLEFTSASTLIAGQYNSELIGSTMFLQCHSSNTMFVYKVVSATDKMYAARIVCWNIAGTGTIGVIAYDTTKQNGTAPIQERNAYMTRMYTSNTWQAIYTNNAGSQVYNNTPTISPDTSVDVFTVEPSKLRHMGVSSPNGNMPRGFSQAGSSASKTILQAGFVAGCPPSLGTSSGVYQQYVAIDWIRKSA